MLAIGGLGWDPGFPKPTHKANGAPGSGLVGVGLPWCDGVEKALAGLPPASLSPENGLPLDHYVRPPHGKDLLRFRALAVGKTMRDLPEDLWHETFRRRAFRRVKDGTPSERRGGPPAGLRRLDPSLPSKAITSGATSEFVHPSEHRNLTLRECARLQTFPDDFEFFDTRAQRALLIANAVPPRLASVIASHLADAFSNMPARRAPGCLRSFVPTNSSGMSPALQQTVREVGERYGNIATPFFPVQMDCAHEGLMRVELNHA